MSLKGKTLFITGASRGIGLAIAMRAARDGANVAIAAKTTEPHPKLSGTIYTAAEDIEKAGGKALPLIVDVRDEQSVLAAVAKTVETFGGIDICVCNASAINLTKVEDTEMKRYDLMHQINVRGTFLTAKSCIPHLKKSANPHILVLSPPLELRPEWFGAYTAYTMSKYGMSMCALGMSDEFRGQIGVNSLWPRTTIGTAALNIAGSGDDSVAHSRTPEIMADAAYEIFNKPAKSFTGNFLIDDGVLGAAGVRDFDKYRIDPSTTLNVDLFVDPQAPLPPGSTFAAAK